MARLMVSSVTSLDLSQLETFFSSLEIGHGGVVSLVRLDGALLARGGAGRTDGPLRGYSQSSPRRCSARCVKSCGKLLELVGQQRTARWHQPPHVLPCSSRTSDSRRRWIEQQSIFEQADATRRVYFIAGTS